MWRTCFTPQRSRRRQAIRTAIHARGTGTRRPARVLNRAGRGQARSARLQGLHRHQSTVPISARGAPLERVKLDSRRLITLGRRIELRLTADRRSSQGSAVAASTTACWDAAMRLPSAPAPVSDMEGRLHSGHGLATGALGAGPGTEPPERWSLQDVAGLAGSAHRVAIGQPLLVHTRNAAAPDSGPQARRCLEFARRSTGRGGRYQERRSLRAVLSTRR